MVSPKTRVNYGNHQRCASQHSKYHEGLPSLMLWCGCLTRNVYACIVTIAPIIICQKPHIICESLSDW